MLYFLLQYIYKSVQGKGRIVSDCLRLLKFAVLSDIVKNEHIRIWNWTIWWPWMTFLEFTVPTLIVGWLATKEFIFRIIENVEIMKICCGWNFGGVRCFQWSVCQTIPIKSLNICCQQNDNNSVTVHAGLSFYKPGTIYDVEYRWLHYDRFRGVLMEILWQDVGLSSLSSDLSYQVA